MCKLCHNAASHIRLSRAQKTSTDCLEGALREREALRVEISALRRTLNLNLNQARTRAENEHRPPGGRAAGARGAARGDQRAAPDPKPEPKSGSHARRK